MTTEERLQQIRERLSGISPTPWAYNSYSRIVSVPQMRVEEDEFWTEERFNDDHTYDKRIGELCPGCGDRPMLINGERRGTFWDCALYTEAYEADCEVASVPPHHGDTAIGRRCRDAELIANAPDDLAFALSLLEEKDKRIEELETEREQMATTIRIMVGAEDSTSPTLSVDGRRPAH